MMASSVDDFGPPLRNTVQGLNTQQIAVKCHFHTTLWLSRRVGSDDRPEILD